MGILDKNGRPLFLPKTDREVYEMLSFVKTTVDKLLEQEPLVIEGEASETE